MVTIELQLDDDIAKALMAYWGMARFPGVDCSPDPLTADICYDLLRWVLYEHAAPDWLEGLAEDRTAIEKWFADHRDREQLDEADLDDDPRLEAHIQIGNLPATLDEIQADLDNRRQQIEHMRAVIVAALR
jgi:hypothetical protein